MLASNRISRVLAVALMAAAGSTLVACGDEDLQEPRYIQINLVSDKEGVAAHRDLNLVNPWGIAYGASTPFWVANNGTGTSTVYNRRGSPSSTVVTIPLGESSSGERATPTGVVYNGSGDFVISEGDASAPARFLFATEDGTIAGWNQDVNPRRAILAVACGPKAEVCPNGGAVYKGLAIAREGGDMYLYAANFSAAQVDVFDGQFNLVDLGAGAFEDSGIPAGFAPFNIQEIKGVLYVTYARQSANGREDVPGAGEGFVNAFRPDGTMIRRVVTRGELNAPWGLARGPSGFGPFTGRLLVGNFGDGRIHAYDFESGSYCGELQDDRGRAIEIEGLWALTPGNGKLAGDSNKIYFTAGIDDEEHGLFGALAHTYDP